MKYSYLLSMDEKVTKSDSDWQKDLTEEQYNVLRCSATEAPFTGEYVHEKREGMYVCAGCGNTLFASDVKYDSGSGWPSFTEPAGNEAVGEQFDESHGMRRTEVHCNKCGGHLGHVFPDGPSQLENGKAGTGMRYCINSAALKLKPKNGVID